MRDSRRDAKHDINDMAVVDVENRALIEEPSKEQAPSTPLNSVTPKRVLLILLMFCALLFFIADIRFIDQADDYGEGQIIAIGTEEDKKQGDNDKDKKTEKVLEKSINRVNVKQQQKEIMDKDEDSQEQEEQKKHTIEYTSSPTSPSIPEYVLSSGLFKYENDKYDQAMESLYNDYYYYKNRTQYPQVTFNDSESAKDIVLMFENRWEFSLFWIGSDFDNAIKSFEYRQIPCDHMGVKSCTITLRTDLLSRADAIVQIAAFKGNSRPSVHIRNDQAYVGYYTEADDSGCQKPSFDAKLSYSPDATIRFNDNCQVVKVMKKCMGRAVRIVSKKDGLEQKEIVTEAHAMDYQVPQIADVAFFVTNCGKPRLHYIESLLNVTHYPEGFKASSYGKCLKNMNEFGDKVADSKKHKFLFSMENKIKRDYVSEKMFQAFHAGIVPIYQGAPNVFDYAPNGSFIGVYPFATPQEVTDYVGYLVKNETAYDEFFNWDFEAWLRKPHTIQCLQIEAQEAIDAGWCSTCDWVSNVFPVMKSQNKKNCDKIGYAPYFGYPRHPENALDYRET